MPRKGHIQKRDVLADPVYKNKIVTKLINNIMLDGKKGVAQKIVYGAFEQVAEQTGKDALEVFDEAMNNVMPELEVKARRIGGSNRGSSGSSSGAVSSLVDNLFSCERGKDHEGETCQ